MSFITKLDFSNNRQVKQYPETLTNLSGATQFGVPYSYLPTGPNLNTSGLTQTYYNLTSSFSGNSATTVFNWFNPNMVLCDNAFSAITPSNSGLTQNSGVIFTGNTSGLTADNYFYYIDYSGISFDINVNSFIDLGSGNYSGTVETTELLFYSADTIDFSGRTIWVDVSGITKTEDLIVSKNPSIGYVLYCSNNEGKAIWGPISGVTGASSHWSASTGLNAIVVKNGSNTASGILSLAFGTSNTASGDYSHASGENSIASGRSSHAEGRTTTASGLYSHSEGAGTVASAQNAHAEGQNSLASAQNAHAEGSDTIASGASSHAEGTLTQAIGDSSHSQGTNTIAIGDYSNASGFFSIASGNTSFVHGKNSLAIANSCIVLGDNITGTSANHSYVESLNIKTVGSSPFVNQLRIDANGYLTTNTSDIRLKEEIKPIEDALSKIKALDGVSYKWKDRYAGGDDEKLGFIAQQVEKVDSRLVFTDKVSGIKGVHIDEIIPLLVEAVKELCSDEISGKTFIETQSIVAEDNNIELNYGGNKTSSINGGIRVLHGVDEEKSADLLINEKGQWFTNNDFVANGLIIPEFTPLNSNDENGKVGYLTYDENFIYIKTKNGWKRTGLESF